MPVKESSIGPDRDAGGEPGTGGPVEPVVHPAARDDAAEQLIGAVSTLRRAIRRAAGPAWPLAPLTGSQVELLRLVRLRPGVSVRGASAELNVAANTVSTLVRQLVDVGLLRREQDAGDRRVARLWLTGPAGRRLAAWRDRRVAAVDDALGRLSAADQRRLRAAAGALDRLAGELLRADRNGNWRVLDCPGTGSSTDSAARRVRATERGSCRTVAG